MIPASIYPNFPALHSCTLPGRRSLLQPLAVGLDALEKQPGIGARVVVVLQGAAGNSYGSKILNQKYDYSEVLDVPQIMQGLYCSLLPVRYLHPHAHAGS